MHEPKVLIVATSRKTRGGITSVIKAHETGEQWKRFHCRWIGTHRDLGLIVKFLVVVAAMGKYVFLLPFYDIVHFHVGEAPSALRKSPFMWYAKLWKKKTIVHFHSFSPETTIRGRFAFLYRYLFRGADRVVVLSEYWKKEVGKEIPQAKCVIIYNPCTAEVNTLFSYKKQKNILYAGTVFRRKGYFDLLKAFAKIADKHSDWSLVFAGNGEIEKGKAIAEQLSIQKQVKWLGWVNGDDKDKAFREASIFCLPSYAEGFPMSVLDAWAYGLPVITTLVGGIPDIAKHGENMLVFEPGDIDVLAANLENMISDDALRENIANESRRLSETTFNLKIINGNVGSLYEELISEK